MPTNTKSKSSKKSATARANGAKSRGPATAEGLARSSQNALRHGLSTAAEFTRGAIRRRAALPTVSVVLDDESPADFQRLLDSYLDEFAPTSPLEVELIETMVSARWRLRRLANIETTLLANEMETTVEDIHNFFADVDREPTVEDHLAYAFRQLAGGARLHLLNRYEGTIGRSYARAFKQLQLLRSLRVRAQPNEPKQSLQSLPSLPVEPSGDAMCASVPDRAKSGPARATPLHATSPQINGGEGRSRVGLQVRRPGAGVNGSGFSCGPRVEEYLQQQVEQEL